MLFKLNGDIVCKQFAFSICEKKKSKVSIIFNLWFLQENNKAVSKKQPSL